jgi:hypothetical protein
METFFTKPILATNKYFRLGRHLLNNKVLRMAKPCGFAESIQRKITKKAFSTLPCAKNVEKTFQSFFVRKCAPSPTARKTTDLISADAS